MLTSLVATVVLAVLVVASPAAPRAPLLSRATPLAQVITTCTKAKTVALTFDDGPYLYIKNISQALTNAGAKGTFFFNGDNWSCIYDQASVDGIKYAYGQGHQVGSHTWAHKDLTTLTWDQIHDEMWRVEQALTKIVGAYPAFMRPPYGNYNDLVRQASYVRGQKLVIWDFDSGDSVGATWQQSDADYDAAIAKRPNTMIALNHETYQTTAQHVVPHAITAFKNAGYQLVTVAECLGLNPYQSVTSPGTRDSTWTC